MTRADSGIERLDYSTYKVLLGGLGDTPEDVGHQPRRRWYFAPRLGRDVPPRREVGAARRLRPDHQPAAVVAPDARLVPVRHQLQPTAADQFDCGGTLADGIPAVPIPTSQLRPRDAAARRLHALAEPGPTSTAASIQQWNVAYEHRLPCDIAAEVAYVGTRTDGGYADLNVNYGVPGGGNAARQYFAVAGTTAINDWAARTKSRYNGLQVALNRPFKNGLLLKGAYT